MKKALVTALLMAIAGGVHAGADLSEFGFASAQIEAAAKAVPVAVSAGVDRLTEVKGATAFDKLKSLFDEGVPAVKEDLLGWHAGRVVDSEEKDRFYARLLVGMILPVTPNGGPLFDGEKVLKLCELQQKSYMVPDSYDNMTDYDKSVLLKYTIEASINDMFLLEFPGAKVTYKGPDGESVTEYRKARGYIVEHYLSHETATGKTYELYEYYFKDVTPK